VSEAATIVGWLAEPLSLRQVLACRTFWGLAAGALALWLVIPRRLPHGRTMGGALGIVGLALVASDWPLLPSVTDQVLFWLLAGVAILAAVGTVGSYSPVYSAIWLALSLLATAGLFFFNGAQFLGVATIVVYAGAIVVTFLFVLMLAQPQGHAHYDRITWGWFPKTFSVLAAAAIVGILTLLLAGLKDQAHAAAHSSPSDQTAPAALAPPVHPILRPHEHMPRLGAVLFSQHLVSVEVAGTLLLAALVGAVAIAAHGRRRLEMQIEEAMR
jgi:NADH-quinone oxidoreductase subunit J